MSRRNAERLSRNRAHIRLRRVAVALAVLLIPHVLLALRLHWATIFVSIHIGAAVFTGLAALLISRTCWLAQRWDEQRHAAVQEGRAETFDAKFAELEQRIDHK